jgi:ParB family chromosome partitioning protein
MARGDQKLIWVEPGQLQRGKFQYRRRFGLDELQELADSIAADGIEQPPIVRAIGEDRYEILAGERRWRASMLAKIDKIPVLVREDIDDEHAHVLGVIENLQRASLNPIEEATAFAGLAKKLNLTHAQVAKRIGKSRVYVTHAVQLLRLPEAVQLLLIDGSIEAGHGKVLATLSAEKATELARKTAAKGLSVRVLERLVKKERPRQKRQPCRDPNIMKLEETLSDHLQAPVNLDYDSKSKRGKLVLEFHSLDELDGLLSRIGYSAETD